MEITTKQTQKLNRCQLATLSFREIQMQKKAQKFPTLLQFSLPNTGQIDTYFEYPAPRCDWY